MIPGGKGRLELAIRNREANEKRFLLAEAFFAPYLVNYVFAWHYSGARRFSLSGVFGRLRTLQFAFAYSTPYSLRSTRRSWILSDSEGLEMGDGKITGTNKP